MVRAMKNSLYNFWKILFLPLVHFSVGYLVAERVSKLCANYCRRFETFLIKTVINKTKIESIVNVNNQYSRRQKCQLFSVAL